MDGICSENHYGTRLQYISLIAELTEFLAMESQEQRDVFEDAARRLQTETAYIEKDLWVCCTLELLFSQLPSGHPQFRFKGGTSLSKIHKVIHRFSEDIDIVVSRHDLGFTDERDPCSETLSTNSRKRLIDELKTTCATYVDERLKPALVELARAFSEEVTISMDPDDDDNSSLLLSYPTLFPSSSDYVPRRVKIECGARSPLEPFGIHSATAYISDSLPQNFNLEVRGVHTLAAEITFWDKALILHGHFCGHRDSGRLPEDRNRVSRHYYDLALMSETSIAGNALGDTELRKSITTHSNYFFRRAWMKLEEAQPGSFKLVPEGELRKRIEADYRRMKGMLTGEVPEFNDLLTRLEALEDRINKVRFTNGD